MCRNHHIVNRGGSFYRLNPFLVSSLFLIFITVTFSLFGMLAVGCTYEFFVPSRPSSSSFPSPVDFQIAPSSSFERRRFITFAMAQDGDEGGAEEVTTSSSPLLPPAETASTSTPPMDDTDSSLTTESEISTTTAPLQTAMESLVSATDLATTSTTGTTDRNDSSSEATVADATTDVEANTTAEDASSSGSGDAASSTASGVLTNTTLLTVADPNATTTGGNYVVNTTTTDTALSGSDNATTTPAFTEATDVTDSGSAEGVTNTTSTATEEEGVSPNTTVPPDEGVEEGGGKTTDLTAVDDNATMANNATTMVSNSTTDGSAVAPLPTTEEDGSIINTSTLVPSTADVNATSTTDGDGVATTSTATSTMTTTNPATTPTTTRTATTITTTSLTAPTTTNATTNVTAALPTITIPVATATCAPASTTAPQQTAGTMTATVVSRTTAAPTAAPTLPPSEFPIQWTYAGEAQWQYLSTATKACGGTEQSPIALGVPPSVIGIAGYAALSSAIGGGVLSSVVDKSVTTPAPTRVINGFGPIFENCRFTNEGPSGGLGWVYMAQRIQNQFMLRPLPNGVPSSSGSAQRRGMADAGMMMGEDQRAMLVMAENSTTASGIVTNVTAGGGPETTEGTGPNTDGSTTTGSEETIANATSASSTATTTYTTASAQPTTTPTTINTTTDPATTNATSTQAVTSTATTAATPPSSGSTTTRLPTTSAAATPTPTAAANTCRMIKADGSVWVLDRIVPKARSEHTLNGVTYQMAVDFVFTRNGTIVPDRRPSALNESSTGGNKWTNSSPTAIDGYHTSIVSILMSDEANAPVSSPATRATTTVPSPTLPPAPKYTYDPSDLALLVGTGLGAFIDDAMSQLPDDPYGPPVAYSHVNANYDLLDDAFSQRAFFTYGGSLTTPPCTEGVSWLVSAKAVRISSLTAQRLMDSTIKAFGASSNGRNQRPLKAANGRTVLYFTGSEGPSAPFYTVIRQVNGGGLSGRWAASNFRGLGSWLWLMAVVVGIAIAEVQL